MIVEPSSKPGEDGRVAIRRFTLALAPLLLGLGCFTCHARGCDRADTLMKTVTYTLSGLAGWLAYLLAWRPSDARCIRHAVYVMFGPYLQPTVPPWRFWRMLALQTLFAILMMLLVGLIESRIGRRVGVKPTHRSSIHPLSDDQVA